MKFLLFTILLFLNTPFNGQIKGTLYKNNGEVYPDILIHNKGKTKSTITDKQGNFNISANIGDTLIIGNRYYLIHKNPLILKINENVKITDIKEVRITINPTKSFESIEMERKDINLRRGTSNGDLFNGIPGVQLNNIRNEAGALDIGIRGVQGEGRVPVVIDGGLQSAHTNRGYQGSSDRTYIEMDLVKKVKIDKGASFNPNSIEATGGFVELKTIDAEDVVLPGKNFGVYFKTNLSNNSKLPKYSNDENEQMTYRLQRSIKESHFNNGNITLAFGYKGKKVDILSAFNMHIQGNYFAGKNGADRYGYDPYYYENFDVDHSNKYSKPAVRPEQEVVNTSYVSQSGLMKLTWNIDEHQKISLNYRYHYQKAGEVLAAYWYKILHNKSNNTVINPPKGVEFMAQWSPGTTLINSYIADYKYNPNNKVNLNVSIFANTGYFNQRNGLPIFPVANRGDQYLHESQNNRWGAIVYNKTMFTGIVPTTLVYGVNLQTERSYPIRPREKKLGAARNGTREVYSAFISSTIELNKFLFEANLRAHQTKVYDYVKERELNYGTKINAIAKLVYSPFKQLGLYLKASSVFRSPSLYESTVSRQTFNYNEKSPLVQENMRSIELGFQTHFSKVFSPDDQFMFRANGFYNNIKNYLSAAQIENIGYTFLNYDRFLLKGLELSADYNSRNIFFNISAILYDTPSVCSRIMSQKGDDKCTSQGFSGSLIPNRIPPKQSFITEAGTYAFNKKLMLGGRIKYHSAKENPKNWLEGTGAAGIAHAIPADTVIDVFGFYQLNKNVSFNLSIDNITDRYKYDVGSVISMPIPGRTIRIGLESRF